MKKTLLTVMLAIATTFAMAQTYTDNLEVSIMGSKEAPQETTIVVNQASDGTYTLSLNNFILGGAIPVGNIVIDNIATTESNGIKSFEVVRNILITADGEDWIGPTLGEVPVNLIGKMDAKHLYCTINITMEELGTINVVFGDRNNFVASTKTYTEQLVVVMNEEQMEPQETTIAVETNKDGSYTLSLNNFVLGGLLEVGNIVVESIAATTKEGITSFTANRNILIAAGDTEGEWLGPNLGEVPVNITGKMDAEHLYCTISITMEELGTINVVFGEEGNVTNISAIAAENGANVIYDLTGRRIEAITTAGIYIVNGKKVLVK